MKSTKKAQQAKARGKVIASARKKTGDSTNWGKIFQKLDASKKGK
jgi:hypothetical protein